MKTQLTLLLSAVIFFVGENIAFSQTFNYTGAQQTYTVPVGVSLLTIECWGAQGAAGVGAAGGTGASGGYSKGDLIVTPGQTLYLYVGGQIGYNGGANGGNIGAGNGGGGSDARIGGATLGDRIIVGGGGGGGGATGCLNDLAAGNGGNGGGGAGGAGASSANGFGGFGGTVGIGGGAGLGCPSYLGTPGLNNGTGGDGQGCCCTTTPGGGGGGGGYVVGGGGGGGSAGNPGCGGNDKGGGGGGAGGSSWTGTLTSPVMTSGLQTGNGVIVISIPCTAISILVDVNILTDSNDECSISMPTAPTATNNCGAVINGVPDVTFPINTQGTTQVTWTYDDGLGNVTSQTQDFIIVDLTVPVPDSTSLPDLLDQCQVMTLVAPTANDNCAGTITGTTSSMVPITVPGTSTITWTFDDGNGNISTQNQAVINPTIDNTVMVIGATIQSNEIIASYQWLDCGNGNAVIPNENNQSYTAIETGDYAVELNVQGCIDTSGCETIDFTGIPEIGNPTKELLKITDLNGRETQFEINKPLIFIYSDGTKERVMKLHE